MAEGMDKQIPLPGGEGEAREALAVDDETAAAARDLCARLIVDTAVPREEAVELESDPRLRAEVERRLARVGLRLVTSGFAGVYALRLTTEVAADPSLSWSINRRMPRGAVALLVALWARLVLPRRALMERREDVDGSRDLFGSEAPPSWPDLQVHRDALLMEFGPRLGRTNVIRYLGILRNRGFVEVSHGGEVREGPLLDVLLDGDELALKLRDSVLRDVLAEGPSEVDQEELPLPAAPVAPPDPSGTPDPSGPPGAPGAGR